MYHPRAGSERLQGRNSYRLYVVSDGVLTLEEEGHSDEFRAGDVLLVPPGGDRVLSFSQRAAPMHLVFDVIGVPRRRTRKGGWRHDAGVGPQPGPLAVWGVDLPRRVPAALCGSGRDMVHRARAWYWRGAVGYARACGHLAGWLGDLVYAFAPAAERDSELAADDQPRALEQALEVIEDRRMAPLPIGSTAERAGISREHLARLARQHLGRPLRVVRQERQADMAARLLQETDHSIAQIAQILGYRHSQSFQRSFQRWFGITPARFRAGVR